MSFGFLPMFMQLLRIAHVHPTDLSHPNMHESMDCSQRLSYECLVPNLEESNTENPGRMPPGCATHKMKLSKTTLSWMVILAENATSHFWQRQDSEFFKGQPRKNARDPYVSTRNPHCSLHFCWHISAQINQRDPTESPIKDHLKFQNVQKKNVSNSIQACKDGAIQYAKRDDVRLYDTVVQMYIYICISYIDIYIYMAHMTWRHDLCLKPPKNGRHNPRTGKKSPGGFDGQRFNLQCAKYYCVQKV